MEYQIRDVKGPWREVTGKPIILKGFEDYAFFYRKHNGSFIISEVTTGKYIDSAYTLKDARKSVTERLTLHRDQFIKLVEEA